MTWACNRHTTRVEDEAYCLMGFFDVNMPLLYGEGGKAFRRLQEEIIKRTNDQSILVYDRSISQELGRLLAPSPRSFRNSKMQVMKPEHSTFNKMAITHHGLEIHSYLCPVRENNHHH